jgi:hypothetical protein
MSFPPSSLRAVGDGTGPLIARVPDAAAWTDWEVYTATGLVAALEPAFVYDVELNLLMDGYFRSETLVTEIGAERHTRVVFVEGDRPRPALPDPQPTRAGLARRPPPLIVPGRGPVMVPTELPAWSALRDHHAEVAGLHLRDLFARDAGRFDRLHLRIGEILFDFSKHRVTDETLRLLVELARQAGLEARIAAMFDGEPINGTEGRAVLHTPCGTHAPRGSTSTAATSCPRSTRCSRACATSAPACATGATWAPPGARSPTSSTSASAAATSDPRWSPPWPRTPTAAAEPLRLERRPDRPAPHARPLDPATTLFLIASKTFTTRRP